MEGPGEQTITRLVAMEELGRSIMDTQADLMRLWDSVVQIEAVESVQQQDNCQYAEAMAQLSETSQQLAIHIQRMHASFFVWQDILDRHRQEALSGAQLLQDLLPQIEPSV